MLQFFWRCGKQCGIISIAQIPYCCCQLCGDSDKYKMQLNHFNKYTFDKLTLQFMCHCIVKILSVDKGFYIGGGSQLFGKFKSLKHCMKACANAPTCFSGDYNPWLHKCYQHSNITACDRTRSHPQFVHFSKVPCSKQHKHLQ